MISRHSLTLYKKELRETLRDRKTLIVMILLPLALYPVLSVGGAALVTKLEAERAARVSKVGMVGRAPGLERLFADPDDKIQLVFDDGRPRESLEKGRLHAVLEVPPAFDASVAAGQRPTLRILFDASEDESRQAKDRIRDATESLATVSVDSQNVASEERLGAFILSQVLPFAVVFMVVLGAFYPSIDVTAGERERSTLETLLSSPVDRIDVVTGKFLAVTTIAIATGLLNLGSIAVTFGYLMSFADGKLAIDIPWLHAAETALAIVPAACFFAALFLTVASLARSYKEAQTLLTPVYLVSTLPAMVAALPGSKLTWAMSLVPGANLALLAKDVVQGRAEAGPALLALASTFAYAAALLALAARLYTSERVLFAGADREISLGERLRLLLGMRSGTQRVEVREAPSAAEAMALLGINVILQLFVALPLQQHSIARGLLVSQWGLFLGSTVLLLRASRVDLRKALLLRLPSGRDIGLGLGVGVAASVLVQAVFHIVMQVWPALAQQNAALEKQLVGLGSLPVELVIFAATPAICEEALFRGALLSGLRRALPVPTAIIVQAFAFGLFHLDPVRLVPTTLLGLLLGLLATRTGSLLPGVLMHFANNALVLSASHLGARASLPFTGGTVYVTLFAAMVTLVVLVQTLRSRAVPR